MNVYDFDKTIYDGDASLDFWKYKVRKEPLLLGYLPYQVFSAFLFKAKIISRKEFKQCFFIFLRSTRTLDLGDFWDHHQSKIKPWYLKQKQPDDLIISASPEFILKEMTDRLQISLIGTRMNPKTGKITGENCRGEEKVLRFKKQYQDASINQFYSDSQSDTPLKLLAKESFLVKKDQLNPWL